MIVEKFLKKYYIDEDNETCDKVLELIDEFWMNDFKHTIEYEYFEKVNNTIIKIYSMDIISNFDSNRLRVKNNLSKFNNFVNFFSDKCEFIMRPYSSGSIQFQLIFYNNIQDVLKELEMIQTSKKYNL